METALTKILAHLASLGPGFIVAAVFIVFYVWERKKSAELTDKLQELTRESIKADTEHCGMLQAFEKALDRYFIQGPPGR